MDDTAKYLIHADVTADGVVERSDVVGAVFGQTEGLLGDELDIRGLQQSAKLGRIDVEVESEGGRSFGHITIASNLDRVETAVLAAALESIDRVGPCRSEIRVTDIEDARAAKRRDIADRATELLNTAFDEGALTSAELVEQVRESVRVEDITEYEGFPAGPRVAEGDAVIVVEGRADVLTLLQYGIKNAVAVEGTNVPDAVAALTAERTTTAFLDGDRGGDLILRELAQVGDVDYVARAPEGRSVEDLSRQEVRTALREKVNAETALAALSETEGEGESGESGAGSETEAASGEGGEPASADLATNGGVAVAEPTPEATERGAEAVASEAAGGAHDAEAESRSLAEHVRGIEGRERARLLDADLAVLADVALDDLPEAIEGADAVPSVVVLDGPVDQRLVDVAAQRGVERVVGTGRGQFTKQPAGVRVHTTEEVLLSEQS